MMRGQARFGSRSLTLIEKMEQGRTGISRERLMPWSCPDMDILPAKQPRWWSILNALWGDPWNHSSPPCLFYATPFGCKAKKCPGRHVEVIKAQLHRIAIAPFHCGVCRKFSTAQCAGCGKAVYCTPQHQKAAWPQHKLQCAKTKKSK